MPIAVIVIAITVFIIIGAAIVGIALGDNKPKLFYWAMGCLFISTGLSIWIAIAWFQNYEHLHYMKAYEYVEDNKQIQFIVNKETAELVNLNKKFQCVIQSDTIVEAVRIRKHRCGINWMNARVDYILITPNDAKYKKAKDAVSENSIIIIPL